MKRYNPKISRTLSALLALGAGHALEAKSSAHAQMRSPSASLPLIAIADPWEAAQPRWRDIGNTPFHAFLGGQQRFSYENSYPYRPGGTPIWNTQATLIYDRAPGVPYFVGRIQARGLKPNFAYQLKLMGKPQRGARGWGERGDDVANERLGYAGRWWCDSYHYSQTNFDDWHYLYFYKEADPGQEHAIAGYLFMGVFVTDAKGDASVDISGRNSYHITWQGWQNGRKDTFAGAWRLGVWPFDSRGPSPFYGYGAQRPSRSSVSLFYEYEPNRPQPVVLPRGTYNCRLVLTEESFHSDLSNGGYWQSVLATEDADDTSTFNDIVFTVGAPPPVTSPPPPRELFVATSTRSQVVLRWTDASSNEAGFRVERARVDGEWEFAGTAPANATSFTDSGLERNTLYSYRVASTNSAGASAFSNTVAVRTGK
jgi:hypothetical protein